jgi:hypothetical protein
MEKNIIAKLKKLNENRKKNKTRTTKAKTDRTIEVATRFLVLCVKY